MPLRSLRWIRPSAGPSWARAVGATAAVAVAAAGVLMNARRFISYGAVMALPLQLDDPGIVTSYHSRLDGRIASTFVAECGKRTDGPTKGPPEARAKRPRRSPGSSAA